MSYVGAAGCVTVMEDIFAMVLEKLIVFDTCGVLDSSINDCSVIIPNIAMRDEGTSLHYAPPSDEIAVNLDSEVWDARSISNQANPIEKDRIATLAIELAIALQ